MLALPLGRPRAGFAVVAVVAFWAFVDALDLDGGRLARVVGWVVLVSAFALVPLDLDLNLIRPSSSASLGVLVPLSFAVVPTTACRLLRLGGTGVDGAIDCLELGRADAGVEAGVGIR